MLASASTEYIMVGALPTKKDVYLVSLLCMVQERWRFLALVKGWWSGLVQTAWVWTILGFVDELLSTLHEFRGSHTPQRLLWAKSLKQISEVGEWTLLRDSFTWSRKDLHQSLPILATSMDSRQIQATRKEVQLPTNLGSWFVQWWKVAPQSTGPIPWASTSVTCTSASMASFNGRNRGCRCRHWWAERSAALKMLCI